MQFVAFESNDSLPLQVQKIIYENDDPTVPTAQLIIFQIVQPYKLRRKPKITQISV